MLWFACSECEVWKPHTFTKHFVHVRSVCGRIWDKGLLATPRNAAKSATPANSTERNSTIVLKITAAGQESCRGTTIVPRLVRRCSALSDRYSLQ